MLKNTLAASVVLFMALLSVSSAAKAFPPDPEPGSPPLAMAAKADPPEPMPTKPPRAVTKTFPPDPEPSKPPLAVMR